MGHLNKKYIFILGHPRSGTTLLNRILNTHDRVTFAGGEFNELPYYYFRRHRYKKFKENRYQVLADDLLGHPFLRLPSVPVRAESFRECVDQLVNRFSDEGSTHVGFKVANRIRDNVEMIKEVFPEAYCIHILRDPRDVHLSSKKMPYGSFTPYFNARSWKNAVNDIRSLRSAVNRFYEIRYEEFIADPEPAVRELCRFLGLEFDSGMMSFYRDLGDVGPHHPLLKGPVVAGNSGKWKKELSPEEQSVICKTAGDTMRETGYGGDRVHGKISLFERVYGLASDKMQKAVRGKYFNMFVQKYLWRTQVKLFAKWPKR